MCVSPELDVYITRVILLSGAQRKVLGVNIRIIYNNINITVKNIHIL